MLRRAVGDDSRVPFIVLASLRSHLMRQPVLTVLTTLVVALSVALVIAVGQSSRGVNATLERVGDAVRGNTDLEITAGPVGTPESLLDEVASISAVAIAAPVVESVVRIAGGPGDNRALRILGVDLLADQSVRNYKLVQSDLRVLDPLRLIAGSDSVIISEILAHDLHLVDGDTLTVRSTSGEHALVVRGLLASGGIGDAYAGQLAIMDVYALQALVSRNGYLDRIDLVLRPEANPEEAKAQVAAKVDGFASVRRPIKSNSLVSAAVSALTFISTVVALVGTLVAGFLCYAALAASVDRRSHLFALLRAAGLQANQVHHLVYLDSLAVGVIGVMLGIPAGVSLSSIFATVFSITSSFISRVEIKPAQVSPTVLLLGAIVGIGVSQVSALIAAHRSTRLSPHEAISGGRGLGGDQGGSVPFKPWFSTATLCATGVALWTVPLPIAPTARAAIGFLLGIALLWVVVGPFLATILPFAKLAIERIASGVGTVAAGSLIMRLNQTRIATASIAVLIATMCSLWVVITSLVTTVDDHVATHGGAIVAASDTLDSHSGIVLSERTVTELESTPGVDAILRQYVTDVAFKDESVRLSAVTSDVLADRMGLNLREPVDRDREVVEGLQSGGVVVYEAFQRHFGTKVGDSVRLETPKGPHEFPVVGVVYRYDAGSTGGVRMDLATFDRFWPRPGISMVVVWGKGDEQARLDALRQGAGRLQPLFIYPASEIGPHAILERYSRLVSVLLGLVALLAGTAVANLLMSSANDLRGDMALLQCLGASRGRIAGVAVAEGVVVGVAGVLAGLVLTLALAPPLRTILSDQFGWSIAWSVHPFELALLGIGTVVASALIGLVMGTRLRRTISWNALTPE